MATFLNELNIRGAQAPLTQETYEFYHKKKQFWKTINWMVDGGLIKSVNSDPFKENTHFKITMYGIIFSGILNHLCKIDTGSDNVLSP